MPVDLDERDAVRVQCPRQTKLHPSIGNQRCHVNFTSTLHDGNMLDFHPGCMPPGRKPAGKRAASVLPVNVLVKLNPQNVQSFGTIVCVGDGFRTMQDMGLRIDPGSNRIVRAVLPVLRTRQTGARPIDIRSVRQGERGKDWSWIREGFSGKSGWNQHASQKR